MSGNLVLEARCKDGFSRFYGDITGNTYTWNENEGVLYVSNTGASGEKIYKVKTAKTKAEIVAVIQKHEETQLEAIRAKEARETFLLTCSDEEYKKAIAREEASKVSKNI